MLEKKDYFVLEIFMKYKAGLNKKLIVGMVENASNVDFQRN